MLNFSTSKPFLFTELNTFAEPRNQYYPMTESYTLGSKAINDVSTDSNTHVWKGYIKDNWFIIRRLDLEEEHQIIETGSVEQLDFTFDQAMRPVLVWVKESKSYMYRYESTEFRTVELPDKIRCPRVELDDKLIANSPTSDIILGYCYDGKLCYAQQRDRYETEYVIAIDQDKHLLWKIGFTQDGRFGFQWR